MYFWIAAAAALIIDQITKLVALKVLAGGKDIVVIPQFFMFHYATNKGAAFSIMDNQPVMLSIISLIAVCILLIWVRSTQKEEKWTRISIGLVFGGAIGNLIDRIFRDYGVIDFLLAHWKNKYYWPVFNMADTFICIGIFLLVILTFFPEVKEVTNEAQDTSGKDEKKSIDNNEDTSAQRT